MQSVTLKFHPILLQYTNGVCEHTVKVNDLFDIRSSLENLFPKLGTHIQRIRCGKNSRENIALVNINKRILGKMDYYLNKLSKIDTEFHVVPLFCGGGGDGTGQMILGAVLIVVGIVVATYGGQPALGMQIAMAGAGMMYGGYMAKNMKTPAQHGPDTVDSESRNQNNIFAGLQNTTSSNVPIPILYGRTRVGGQFISGEILSIQHGRNETIKVSSLFSPGEN